MPAASPELIADYQSGITIADLVDRHGLDQSTIYRHLPAAGIEPSRRATPAPPGQRGRIAADIEAAITWAYRHGEKVPAIAERHQIATGSVYRVLNRHGVQADRQSDQPPNERVIALHLAGATGAEIEAATGVPRGSHWSHIRRSGNGRR